MRRHARSYVPPLRVIGIDDWAFRKNHRYGLIVCDLERRRIAALLPDREMATVEAWFAAIEASVHSLVEARTLVERFHLIIRTKIETELDSWILDAAGSLLASFAAGIMKSKDAVRAAITEPRSNGQTEGQVNKLKMVKRQMYGHAKIDLLEARLIGAE